MVARSSLLRRPTPGARPARRTASVVAALAALAPRLVRLAHHDYPDGLLGMRPLIQLRDVWKVYHLGDVEVRALRGVSLDIRTGEFLAIVGASGSGKSTCMNLIGCLDQPTRGTYRLGNVDVATLSANERAAIRNRRIGFVFQNFNLLGRTTALGDVALPMIYANVRFAV